MKILPNNRAIKKALSDNLASCERLRWAVAWATMPEDLFGALWKDRKKISQLTVGLDFYQTHPTFIRKFIKQKNVKFVIGNGGVFHPKVFYFEGDRGTWNCIIGSANFTQAAMTKNSEVAVWINQDDEGAVSARSVIMKELDRFKRFSAGMNLEKLTEYAEFHDRQKRQTRVATGTYSGPEFTTERRSRAKLAIEIDLLSQRWPKFVEGVKGEKKHKFEDRLDVLERAAELFEEYGEFGDMNRVCRRAIAGVITANQMDGIPGIDEIDWGFFGSMKGNITFQGEINANNPRISAALDEIPLTGGVDEADFKRYKKIFLSASDGLGISTATRLLAMKRPDYFVCVDGPNKSGLAKEFGIPQKQLGSIDAYWDEVVCRVLDSNWWNSPEPSNRTEARIWRGRAAFLDSFVYDP